MTLLGEAGIFASSDPLNRNSELARQSMNKSTNQRNGSPTAALLFGVSFYALASYLPEVMGGTPNAADDLYAGFFKFIGGVAVIGGVAGYYNAFRQSEKRKASEQPSETFGKARFASLDDCEGAGLLDPQGLYLGLLEDQPLFYSGKAHLLTCAPAR